MNFEPDRIIKEIDSQYGKLNVVDMEAYLIRTINDAAEKYGVNNTGFASLLNELGGFYRTTSRYQKSEEFFLKAKEIIERTVGEDNPNYGTTLNNLAGVYRLTGDFIKAEQTFLKAIEIYKRISYDQSFVYSSALNNLGLIYMDTKEFAKAAALFEEANAIAKREKNSPVIYATGLGNLANAYLALGQTEKAKKMLIEAATVYKSFNKEDNNHYASALNSLGTFYFLTNNLRKAEPLFLKVLALRERDFGQNHHEFAKTAYNLCELYEKSGRYELAMKYAKSSAASYLNIFGKDHPSYKTSADAVARLESPRNDEKNRFSQTTLSMPSSEKVVSGMELAFLSFVQFSASVLCKKFPDFSGRIAAGLVGEGSECYGFDDELSKDHDWGPSFCLWLTKEDYEKIGPSLQQEYNLFLKSFHGHELNTGSPLTTGRRGVFEIGEYYSKYLGTKTPPSSFTAWQSISESNLSAVTNGKVFIDPIGKFSACRSKLLEFYPEDLRLMKIATACAIMAQSGQYNYPRSIKRKEDVAALHGLSSFIDATISVVFLINKKYKPYYKWMHRGMKSLPILGAELYEMLQQLVSAAEPGKVCFLEERMRLIEKICRQVYEELRKEGLSDSPSSFLIDHAKQVQMRITAPELRGMPISMVE